MPQKMSRRLVLVSSAAIAALYAAGYVETQKADAQLGGSGAASQARSSTTASQAAASQAQAAAPPVNANAAPPAVAQVARSSSASTTASTTTSSQQAAAAPPTATPIPTPTPQSGYRDGTYSGTGTSRRGDVSVAVTVKGGKITNVAITQATTQYPTSWISDLPKEVLAQQSAQVDLISGATYSSLAFQEGVQQALAQAGGSSVPTSSGSYQFAPAPAAPFPARRRG